MLRILSVCISYWDLKLLATSHAAVLAEPLGRALTLVVLLLGRTREITVNDK
jgi:hypothetical protein